MQNISRRWFVEGAGALLAASAFGGVALADSAGAGGGAYTAGTYTATAPGRNGDVEVSVTFTEDAIVDIASENIETPTIGGAAIETLAEQVIATQALDLDVIVGATMSSEAFLTAVADCVRQAGGDPEAMTGAGEAAVEYVTEADVVIIGAGGAGITAALTASEGGASVILLEKSGVVGGNSLMTSNGINAVDSQLQLSDPDYVAQAPEGGFKALTLAVSPEADEAMLDAYVATSGEMIDWLMSKGMEFTLKFDDDFRNPSTNYWLHMGGGSFETAPKVINVMNQDRKEKDNISLYFDTEATELLCDDTGAVVGVRALTPDGEMDFSAKSVILCTGGFNANKEMVDEVRPDLVNAVIGVRAPTTGDGLRMAGDLGAKVINLEIMNTFGNVMVDYGMVNAAWLPGSGSVDCIYVNQDAQRFTAEQFRADQPAVLANERSYTIFDESGLNNDTLKTLVETGLIKQDETIEGLAGQLDLDPAALAETVAAYNEDIADGVDDAFGRDPEYSTDPLQAPFYGYRFGVGTHYDLGGLVTTAKAEVEREDGSVIEGLYAAGEVVGNFQATFRLDGSGIGESLVFGRIAGKEAASRA